MRTNDVKEKSLAKLQLRAFISRKRICYKGAGIGAPKYTVFEPKRSHFRCRRCEYTLPSELNGDGVSPYR